MNRPIFCTKCGTPLTEANRFCVKCGKAVPAQTPPVSAPPRPAVVQPPPPKASPPPQITPQPLPPPRSTPVPAARGATGQAAAGPPRRRGLWACLIGVVALLGAGLLVGGIILVLSLPEDEPAQSGETREPGEEIYTEDTDSDSESAAERLGPAEPQNPFAGMDPAVSEAEAARRLAVLSNLAGSGGLGEAPPLPEE